MSSIELGRSLDLTRCLVHIWLRTRSETFQPQRRVQVVKDRGRSMPTKGESHIALLAYAESPRNASLDPQGRSSYERAFNQLKRIAI